MSRLHQTRSLWLMAWLLCAMCAPGSAQILVNGGFENGLSGWTSLDAVGSDGTFFAQSGMTSPVNALPVPAPPDGLMAAMTDAGAPGSHVLYQDFFVPSDTSGGSISFSLFINNTADRFANPANLDFAASNRNGGLNLNQQARVDIMPVSADPFSADTGDILHNLFQTLPGDPLMSGYNAYQTDISALLREHRGDILRLRFAEVDNLSIFNFGVDQVAVAAVPEPSALALAFATLPSGGLLAGFRRRRRR